MTEPAPSLYIVEPTDRHHALDGSILVCDQNHNDVAEFFHRDNATVSQTYEMALAMAWTLVGAFNKQKA